MRSRRPTGRRIAFLAVLILVQTVLEVLPDVRHGIPWTQPEMMKYGGFVFLAAALWVLLGPGSSQ